MTFTAEDARRARAAFPALTREQDGTPLAFLDSPGGTQVPEVVIAAIAAGYRRCNVNVGGAFETSREAEDAVWQARTALADLLGTPSPREISLGANMTTLNFALSRAIGRELRRGDEVIVTQLDHEANRGPWLRLAEHGVIIKDVRITRDGQIDLQDFQRQLSARTRLVAVTLASNALGTVPDLAPIREGARAHGALLVCDAVHYAAHFPVDFMALGCDFLLCSAYKFYGPHIGVLASRPGLLETLDTDRLRVQKQAAPTRIETGTLNHPAVLGVTAAIDFLAAFGAGETRRARLVTAMQRIGAYEHTLAWQLAEQLAMLPGVTLHGPSLQVSPRAPTLSISLGDLPPARAAQALAARGLQVWHGHFYAQAVVEALDLTATGGLLRTGFALYNTTEEVDRLVQALRATLRGDTA